MVKNPPAVQETLLLFLGREDPLEKGTATHSSILYSPWGSRRVGQAWVTFTFFYFLSVATCQSQGAHLVLETFDKYGVSSVTRRENLQFWLSHCPTEVPLTCSDALGWNNPSENTTIINGYPFKAVLNSWISSPPVLVRGWPASFWCTSSAWGIHHLLAQLSGCWSSDHPAWPPAFSVDELKTIPGVTDSSRLLPIEK